MATAPQPTVTKRDLETALIEKCWKDADFKKQVVSDPKGMLERHTGQKLPPQIKIFVHEEDANTLHFSIPPSPSNVTELSDDDLEKVAGGTEVLVASIAGAAIGTPVISAIIATGVVTLGAGVVGGLQAGGVIPKASW